jgi:predicted Zn finger-like uncharacterized protein
MYTQCPKCETVFRITAAQLRVAEGEVRCGSCAISFNALTSLSDDLPELTNAIVDDAQSQPSVLDEPHDSNEKEQAAEFTGGTLEFDAPEKSWSRFFISPESEVFDESAADGSTRNTYGEVDESMPTDQDPAEEHSPLEFETSDHEEWNDFLSELAAPEADGNANHFDQRQDDDRHKPEDDKGADPEYSDDPTADQPFIVLSSDSTGSEYAAEERKEPTAPSDDVKRQQEPPLVIVDALPDFNADYEVVDERELSSEAAYELTPGSRASEYLDVRSDDFPAWIADDSEADDYGETREKKVPWRSLGLIALLGAALLGQLLHYNRDDLATHPDYGEIIRSFYAGIGSPLYPEWRLDAFEVRGTEAVAGRSAADALDILATIEVVSDEPVGLPLIRIALHDRWSNPVASRVFYPSEYMGGSTEILNTLSGGTIIPIRISVIDPGTEAQNYVVDICLPDRSHGLLCQLGKDPFQS